LEMTGIRSNKPEVPQPLQRASVIVNFDEQAVFFFGYVIPIDDVDEASINFGGRQIVDYGFSVAIRGNIDRVSGRMDATRSWRTCYVTNATLGAP
jgi:hypothetical protein